MQTQLGRWKSGGCAPTGVGVDRRTPKGSGGSAFVPEEKGGEANEKQNDGGGEIHEVRRVEEGKINGVADDGGGDKNEDDWCPRIAGSAIGNRPARRGAANGENGGGTENVENPADKHHTFDQFAESAHLTSTHQNC